jgi:hypothetical protein
MNSRGVGSDRPITSIMNGRGVGSDQRTTSIADSKMIYFSTLMLGILLAAQPPAAAKTARDPAAERLELMKDAAKSYTLTTTGARQKALTLQPEPAFRLGRQGDGSVLEGAIFLWTDEVGRPTAAAQLFLFKWSQHPDGEWRHEFTSLSTAALTASQRGESRWQPRVPGVAFQPIPGAPKPADRPQQRLRQMRDLASEFRAEDDFWERGWNALRLLPTPISRYGKAGGLPEDGALFAFVLGTDPEVFLFIEARKGAAGLEWQYALAPMTCWALKAEHKSRGVWSLPRRTTDDPSQPFFDRSDEPRPR